MIDKLSLDLDKTDSYYVNRFTTKEVIRDISCKPLGELKDVFFCSEVLLSVSSDKYLRFFTRYTLWIKMLIKNKVAI